jgi:hypothetical protein
VAASTVEAEEVLLVVRLQWARPEAVKGLASQEGQKVRLLGAREEVEAVPVLPAVAAVLVLLVLVVLVVVTTVRRWGITVQVGVWTVATRAPTDEEVREVEEVVPGV